MNAARQPIHLYTQTAHVLDSPFPQIYRFGFNSYSKNVSHRPLPAKPAKQHRDLNINIYLSESRLNSEDLNRYVKENFALLIAQDAFFDELTREQHMRECRNAKTHS